VPVATESARSAAARGDVAAPVTLATIDLVFAVQVVSVDVEVNGLPAAVSALPIESAALAGAPPADSPDTVIAPLAGPAIAASNGATVAPPVVLSVTPDRAPPPVALAVTQVASANIRPEAARGAALVRTLPPEPALPEALQSPAGSAPAREQPGQGPAQWLPRPGDLLPVLPPVDLQALERALRGFVDELKRAGEQLVGAEEGRGPWPWIVAVAAAALALEIARRQLRTRGGAPPDDIPWSPDDPPGRAREESSP
jgi:hypothetical protein